MRTLGFKGGDYNINEICLSRASWERLKKLGDKELYKKYNKTGDYTELRIYINKNSLELDAHGCKG